MTKIRHDLEGVVFPYTADGTPAGFHLSAGDEVPDGIVVGPHLIEPETPEANAAEEPEPAAEAADDEPEAESAGDEVPDGRASRQVWADYADRIGAAYPEGATKAEIRAAVEAHSA